MGIARRFVVCGYGRSKCFCYCMKRDLQTSILMYESPWTRGTEMDSKERENGKKKTDPHCNARKISSSNDASRHYLHERGPYENEHSHSERLTD